MTINISAEKLIVEHVPFRRRFRRAAAILAAAAVLGGAARAGVILRTPEGLAVHWDLDVQQPNVLAGQVTWFVDPGGSLEEPPGDDTEEIAIEKAFQAWQGARGTRVRFRQDLARPALRPDAEDRVNHFSWIPNRLGPFTFALTIPTARNGVLMDVDMIFNDTGTAFLWSTTEPGVSGYADVQSVATHEIGHLLGLDHSPMNEATMAPLVPLGSISARTLTVDDESAVATAYPTGQDLTTGTAFGSIFVGKRRAHRAVAVFALEGSTGRVVSSTFSDRAGRYALRSLPAGLYRLAAVPVAAPAAFSPWWSRAFRDVEPVFLEDADRPGRPALVEVRGGLPTTGHDFRLRRARPPGTGESDDSAPEARTVPLGGWAAGAIEGYADEDWFRFTATSTNAVDIRVRAWGMGSALDPSLGLFAADGTTLLDTTQHIRSPFETTFALGPEGVDLDAEFVRFVPPAPGEYLVLLRGIPIDGRGGPESFYLLAIAPSAGVPDPVLTEVRIEPPAVRAGGPVGAVLTVVPRDGNGDPLGPGTVVTASRSDSPAPVDMQDLGDGTYSLALDAPALPGTVSIAVTLYTDTGSTGIPAAATLTAAGLADPGSSSLTAAPGRIEADGTATSRVTLVPRDSSGRLLGPGIPVTLSFEGPGEGTLSTTVDDGDGSYWALLRAPAAPGRARVTATVDGILLGAQVRVGLGYDLPEVLLDAGSVVAAAAETAGIGKRTERALALARERLTAALDALDAGDAPGAAGESAGLVAALARAERSAVLGPGSVTARDVAEALRRFDHAILDPIAFPVTEPASEKIIVRARAILAGGEKRLAAGDAVPAARLFARALEAARTIL